MINQLSVAIQYIINYETEKILRKSINQYTIICLSMKIIVLRFCKAKPYK